MIRERDRETEVTAGGFSGKEKGYNNYFLLKPNPSRLSPPPNQNSPFLSTKLYSV